MDILSRMLGRKRRHRHLTYLTDRMVLCTMPRSTSAREAQRVASVLLSNHDADALMVVHINDVMPLPGVDNAITVSCETRTLESILTVCRCVFFAQRGALPSLPVQVLMLAAFAVRCARGSTARRRRWR